MKTLRLLLMTSAVLLIATTVRASGPMGVYALIENVEFEPSREEAERVRVYGAFSFYDGAASGVTEPARGYMYFTLPERDGHLARAEWNDLAELAGTGKGVAFGGYAYFGRFESLSADVEALRADRTGRILAEGMAGPDLGVRPAGEEPRRPVPYITSSTGVVVLGANHEPIVSKLRALLDK